VSGYFLAQAEFRAGQELLPPCLSATNLDLLGKMHVLMRNQLRRQLPGARGVDFTVIGKDIVDGNWQNRAYSRDIRRPIVNDFCHPHTIGPTQPPESKLITSKNSTKTPTSTHSSKLSRFISVILNFAHHPLERAAHQPQEKAEAAKPR